MAILVQQLAKIQLSFSLVQSTRNPVSGQPLTLPFEFTFSLNGFGKVFEAASFSWRRFSSPSDFLWMNKLSLNLKNLDFKKAPRAFWWCFKVGKKTTISLSLFHLSALGRPKERSKNEADCHVVFQIQWIVTRTNCNLFAICRRYTLYWIVFGEYSVGYLASCRSGMACNETQDVILLSEI